MNVIFEHTTVIYDNDIAEVLIGFVNHILIAYDENTLRRLVADYAENRHLTDTSYMALASTIFGLRKRKYPTPKRCSTTEY